MTPSPRNLFLACALSLAAIAGAAQAQDSMGKSGDAMKSDAMKSDAMKSDAMKKDGMAKSGGAMKSDAMKKESMGKSDDSMKSATMKKNVSHRAKIGPLRSFGSAEATSNQSAKFESESHDGLGPNASTPLCWATRLSPESPNAADALDMGGLPVLSSAFGSADLQ